MIKIYASIIALFWVISTPVTGQNKKWTLRECIDYAIENNIQAKRQNLQVDINENNYAQSKANRYPSLNANASQSFNFGRSIDPTTNTFVNQQINSNGFFLSTSLDLFNGFQTTNRIKLNQKEVTISKHDVAQAKNEVSLNVTVAYMQVLQSMELLGASELQVRSSKSQLERLEKMFKVGSIAENQIIDLKATLANDQLAIVNAENQLRIAKLNLMQAMNLPYTQDFNVENVDVGEIVEQPYPQTAQKIYETALNFQPSIKSAEASTERNEIALDIAKGSRYPTLSLNGNIATNYSSASKRFNPEIQQIEDYPFIDQLNDNFRQAVSLNLQIPIFNNFNVNNNIQNAKINREMAELNEQDVKNNLRQLIEQAYNTARASANTFSARKSQVEALSLAFKNTETRFNVGAANAVDYNLAKINLDRANADLIRAKYEYLFRIKILDFYQNKPLDF